MRYEVESKVTIEGLGDFTHTCILDFDDNSNVFGRVLGYHKYMYATFPNRRFTLIKAKLLKD